MDVIFTTKREEDRYCTICDSVLTNRFIEAWGEVISHGKHPKPQMRSMFGRTVQVRIPVCPDCA
jgi:hypothetical protein